MKKHFSKFSALFAAAALMASCSSDEPAIKGGDTIPEGMKAYINVSVMNVPDMGSRSGHNDGETVNGSHDEHKIGKATFYFFDSNKKFVMQSSINNLSGSENKDHGDTNQNVEFIGNGAIVLNNLSSNTYPNYMLTVLNAPADFTPQIGQTIEDVRLMLSTIKTTSNTEGNFVMSTSSYYPQTTDNDWVYGVNALKTTDFGIVEAGGKIPEIGSETDKTVEVFVERLAAKVDVTMKVTEGFEEIDGVTYYKIKASVAGNPNEGNQPGDGETGRPEGDTELYVQLSNWGLNGTTVNSYMSKNIDGFNTTTPWDGWNDGEKHRSYWAKSVVYDQDIVTDATPTTLNYISWYQAQNKFITKTTDTYADYCPENTNTPSKNFADNVLQPNTVTSVVFAATLYEKVTVDGATKMVPFDGVRYTGLLFRKAHFIDYVLDYVQPKLYYKSSESTDTETTETDTDITTTESFKKNYTGLNAEQMEMDFIASGTGTGMVYVFCNLKETEGKVYATVNGEQKQVYTVSAENKIVEAKAADITALNEKLTKWTGTEGEVNAANAYNGGAMYYNVPIQHRPAASVAETALGKYGVVRNHWYEVNVNSVANLGHGIFKPGSEEEEGEKIITDPKDPTYFLGATINILSWKIVSQTVDL